MMRYRICKEAAEAELLREDYIALKAQFKLPYHYHESLHYVKETTSVIELWMDSTLKKVYTLTLLLCPECNVLNEDIYDISATAGNIIAEDEMEENPTDIPTDVFVSNIYNNALEIVLSGSPVSKYVRSGCVVWGLGEDMRLKKIVVYMGPEDIKHATFELTYDKK